MDTNNTLIKVKKSDCDDSGSGKSDFIPSKSTSKVVKSFMKCVSTLVLHVENVLSKSNGLLIVNNSSVVNDSDIDVVEHSIKEEPDDASRYLRSIKKCVLQLCLLCVDQNIYVDYDLTFKQIDFYSCLDDSTRSLVTNYLTENVGYMIEHIGFIISMFTQEKDPEEARDIRKSLQKIYKQILLIPLNSQLDEIPEVYKNLNRSLWYSESIQSLAENLCQLRTALIKFKKVFRNRIFEQDYATDDCSVFEISLNNLAKRKYVNHSAEPNTKRLKEEGNESPDHVFLIPNVPAFHNKADENATVRRKKQKHVKNEITATETCENDVLIVDSDTESVKKKKKHKNRSNNSDIELLFSESDAESIKKKNKHKVKTENSEIESIITESETQNIKKKHKNKSENSDIEPKNSENDAEKKRKNRLENSDIESMSSENNADNIKKKHKRKAENKENESIIIEIEPDNIKKKRKNRLENSDIESMSSENNADNIKKKHKRKAENKESESIIIEIEPDNIKKKRKNRLENSESKTSESNAENFKKKKEHKNISENSDIESKIPENSAEKKKKHKNRSENSDIESIFSENDAENIKKKKKDEHKAENKENDSIIVETETDDIKRKYNKNYDENRNNSEIRKTKKHENKSESDKKQSNNSKNRNRSESESSIISIGKLFTSQIEIGQNEINTNGCQRKSNKKSQSTLDKYVKKSKEKENQCSDNDLSHEIFGALSRGELEVVDEDVSDEVLDSVAREANLNENEKFLYIQDLLLEAKENKELSSEMKEKLKNLCVLIDWEVPPIHKVEKHLSAGPSPEEQATLNALGVSNKSYNQDEDAIIRRNWKDFCKIHDLDENPAPFLMLKHGKEAFLKYEERKKFVQFLGKDLLNRPLNSIYRRFKVLHSDKTKLGRFSAEEDELILTYCNKITRDRHKFAALANVLNRSRPHIERRYRTLTKLHNERVHWNLQLDTTIVNELLKAIKSKKVEDLRTAEIILPHYKQVAANMKIAYEKIRLHWLKFLYPKLFSPDPIHVGPIRYKLIKMLLQSKLTDWKKVDWNEIATHFEGLTREFLWGELACIQLRVPDMYRKNLGGFLKFCEKYIKESVKEKRFVFGKRIVKRYRWSSEGQLEPYE